MPKFDWSEQSKPHRRTILGQMMTRWGLQASVFAPVTFDNDYETIYPENTETPQPVFTTTVLLGQQGFHGFRLSNYISLADKVNETIEVTTLDTLQLESQLQITYPDNRLLNLRVIECNTQHALSLISNVYNCVVT